jgi:hypothetical protein
MKQRHKAFQTITLGAFLIILLGLVPAGCQTLEQMGIGRWVPPGNRILIQGAGPHAQTFETADMTVHYQYQTAGNQLKVWGRGDIKYESIGDLTFHMFFLDDKDKVIGRYDFFSYLDFSDFVEMNSNSRLFHRDFTMPPGTKAFAIGYDGETQHTADQDIFEFSYSPFE